MMVDSQAPNGHGLTGGPSSVCVITTTEQQPLRGTLVRRGCRFRLSHSFHEFPRQNALIAPQCPSDPNPRNTHHKTLPSPLKSSHVSCYTSTWARQRRQRLLLPFLLYFWEWQTEFRFGASPALAGLKMQIGDWYRVCIRSRGERRESAVVFCRVLSSLLSLSKSEIPAYPRRGHCPM